MEHCECIIRFNPLRTVITSLSLCPLFLILLICLLAPSSASLFTPESGYGLRLMTVVTSCLRSWGLEARTVLKEHAKSKPGKEVFLS